MTLIRSPDQKLIYSKNLFLIVEFKAQVAEITDLWNDLVLPDQSINLTDLSIGALEASTMNFHGILTYILYCTSLLSLINAYY